MRNILKLAAVAVLSTFIIAAPTNAQAARRTAPVSIKECPDFYAARGGWVSPTCTSAELTAYLSAKGIAMAPAANPAVTYSSVSPSEQARRDSLNYDEDRRERAAVFDASLDDTRADRSAERANRCANRDLGRQVLGSIAGAAVNAVSSRVSRGYYYGGVYYSQGSSCAYRY